MIELLGVGLGLGLGKRLGFCLGYNTKSFKVKTASKR